MKGIEFTKIMSDKINGIPCRPKSRQNNRLYGNAFVNFMMITLLPLKLRGKVYCS